MKKSMANEAKIGVLIYKIPTERATLTVSVERWNRDFITDNVVEVSTSVKVCENI